MSEIDGGGDPPTWFALATVVTKFGDDISPSDRRRTEEGQANAALLMAGVKAYDERAGLIEALREATQAVASMAGHYHPGTGPWLLLDRLNEVLAKAETDHD